MHHILQECEAQEPGPLAGHKKVVLQGDEVDRALGEEGQGERDTATGKEDGDEESKVLSEDCYKEGVVLLFSIISALSFIAMNNFENIYASLIDFSLSYKSLSMSHITITSRDNFDILFLFDGIEEIFRYIIGILQEANCNNVAPRKKHHVDAECLTTMIYGVSPVH